ncbi:glycosyltransferase family 39 protein [Candidatus Daviesbacteria bacterium]|nr:glycosyltransferase family 39 protein [Candidatus Daviesbacteria bacterium]MBI2334794.1 glycosyltransferase family 39 protein [Candidatus Daviesbacteria bacterium]
MSKKLTKVTLILIISLFLFTRLYKIGEIPVSVYWDEASIGYNAYSIAETGKDEWGEFLPLHFRAFGEFKLPVYIYSVVPFVKIFGLNEFAVRFPAVLFSLGAVILTYLLTKKLFNHTAALWSSFFVTVSPWFFIFSRTGYEVTAGLMFYLLAIYLFFFLNKNSWFLFFSILSFILSAYSYNSFRIISPLTLIILFTIERENLAVFKKSLSVVALSAVILGLSLWPIYRLYVYDAGIFRFLAVGAEKTNFIKNYFSHFNPDFLISGDKNLRSQQKGFGQIFPYDFLLLPLGLLFIIKFKSKYGLLALALVLISMIPAAMTKESPHALRSLSVVPFISMISAMGVIFFKKYSFVFLVISLAFFMNYFLNFIYIYPGYSKTAWQSGYREIFMNINDSAPEKIAVPDKDGQPYIFALFYLKYDPEKFRQEVVRNSVDQWGFSTVKQFGKFEFIKDE